jgi:hypothetical protein
MAKCYICGKTIKREYYPPSAGCTDTGKPYEIQLCGAYVCMSAAWERVITELKKEVKKDE